MDAAHLAFGFAREIRDLQRQFAREQQGRDRAFEFISKCVLYLLPHPLDLFVVPLQRRPQLARDPVHIIDGEVYVDGDGDPDVLQHHVTLDRFGFEECLIDEHSYVFLGA